jgi:hypothetical protein
MRIINPSPEELEALSGAYDGLVGWAEGNGIDGRHTLGLLLKAAMMLAVTNNVPKNEVLDVVELTYQMEKFLHPSSEEMH